MMKLHTFPPSQNSRKVQAVALHLDIPLEIQVVDLVKGEQRMGFLKLNPTGRIPVLQDGDFILWESNAIVQYLAAQQPNSLWPDNIKIRADIARWQNWEAAHWVQSCQVLQFENFIKQILNLGEPDAQMVISATERFQREAAVLDAHLASQEYLVNSTLTLADFTVAAQLTYSVPARFPLEGYSHIHRWYEQISQLPAWQKTDPNQHQ